MGGRLRVRLNMGHVYTLSEIKETIAPIAEAYGVTSMSVFGSQARGTATTESDLDFQIDADTIDTLIKLCNFRLDLEDALGVSVDVVTSDIIDDEFLSNIAQEEVLVYEEQG